MEEEKVPSDTDQTKNLSRKKFEVGLLLVLGLLVGFSMKTEATKRITIGSGDYLLSQKDMNAYDLNAIQKNLTAKGDSVGLASPQAAGGTCGQ